MYLPEHFAERRREVLLQVIRDWPLATVVTHDAGGLTANHLPLIVVEVGGELRLQGHVPKANPIGEPASDAQVLVIFQGPQAYVSPSWYPAKQEHGRVVPTWNYQVVHVRGTLTVIDDAQWIRRQIDALTGQQESARTVPWRVEDAPPDYVDRLVTNLKGIEIRMDHAIDPLTDPLIGKTKASQNQTESNRRGVIQGLEASGSDESRKMAALVRESGSRTD